MDEDVATAAVPREDPAEVDRGSIQSIERASAVLGLFDHATRTLTPAIVAERLGLNRTTAHRYLQSLHASGFLDSGFGLGPLIDQLSAFTSYRQQVLDSAPRILRNLSDETGLTAVLSFLGPHGAVVTLVEEASQGTIILTVRIGTVLELRAAQSRALLAFQSDPGVVARLHAHLNRDDARREADALAAARRDRVAWADLGRAGLASVAAPVFGRRDIQAAMGLLGTAAQLHPGEEAAARVRALAAGSERLSAVLST